jgi:uncharacterized protein (TIGR02246 family)
VRSDVASAWSSFRSAWLASQATAATAAFFTDDAINVIPAAAETHGRAAIDSSFAALLATTKITSFTQSSEEVVAVGDLAYERGTLTQTLQQGTGAPHIQRGRYLAIWRRQADGKWKCSRFLFNDAPVPRT